MKAGKIPVCKSQFRIDNGFSAKRPPTKGCSVSQGTSPTATTRTPSGLVETVTCPIHTVTNLWEASRDVLDAKTNKAGAFERSKYDYAVNAIGQRTGVTTSGTAFPGVPSWLWGYDHLGQVVSADSSVSTSDRAYEYDAIGNRKKSANSLTLPGTDNYSSNALNQYTAVDTLGPAYDFDGNATAYPLPVAPSALSGLGWDGENRLISSTVGSSTTTYLYDAQSRRIAKSTAGSSTIYVYDTWNCVAEYTQSTPTAPVVLAKTRLWGTDLSGTAQGAGGVGGLLAEDHHSGTAATFYPTYDGNGNVSEYLAVDGSPAAHFEYDPFGNTVVASGSAGLFDYRFSTKPRDSETGLYYYAYRYYDPLTGRWPSRDPIAEQGGVNLYGFVGNTPTSSIDPDGRLEIGTSFRAAAAAVSAAVSQAGAGIASVGGSALVGVGSGVGLVLAALTGTANAPGIEPAPYYPLEPYPEPVTEPNPSTSPSPSSVPAGPPRRGTICHWVSTTAGGAGYDCNYNCDDGSVRVRAAQTCGKTASESGCPDSISAATL